MTATSFPILDCRGLDGHARGEQHGRLAATEVRRSIDTYRWLLPAMLRRSWEDVCADAMPFLDRITAVTPGVAAELHGMAAGARVNVSEIAALNARSELMARAAIPTAECTTVARRTALGQTWDWYDRQADACVIVITDRYAALTEAGMPAKIGVNADGVGTTLNFMTTTPAPTKVGVPVHALIADVLERAATVGDAVEILGTADVACSATIVVADPAGSPAVVELAPEGRTTIEWAAGEVAHTNHCVTERLAGTDVPGWMLDNSRRRLTRARTLLGAGTDLKDVLCDRAERGAAIDIGVRPDTSEFLRIGTVAAVVMDLVARRMDVAPGRPSETGFTQSATAGGPAPRVGP